MGLKECFAAKGIKIRQCWQEQMLHSMVGMEPLLSCALVTGHQCRKPCKVKVRELEAVLKGVFLVARL